VKQVQTTSETGKSLAATSGRPAAPQEMPLSRNDERRVMHLLANGDFAAVMAEVHEIPGERRSLFLRLCAADATLRRHGVDLATIDNLVAESRQGDKRTTAFALSVQAQFFLWQGAPLAWSTAGEGLALLHDSDATDCLSYLARGRLRFVAAACLLFAGWKQAYREAVGMLDDCLDDFTRGGFTELAAICACHFHLLKAGVTWEDIPNAATIVAAAAERLDGVRSQYAMLAHTMHAHLRFMQGDMVHCHEALRAAHRCTAIFEEFVPFYRDYVAMMSHLVADGPTPLVMNEALRVLDGLATHAPELADGLTITVASVLADLGYPGEARRVAVRGSDFTLPLPTDGNDMQNLMARLDMASGNYEDGRRRLIAGLEKAREEGLDRPAALTLLRAALTAYRRGHLQDAIEMRRSACEQLGAPRSVWEVAWMNAVPDKVGPGADFAIKAMSGSLRVTVRGQDHAPTLAQSRLLTTLLAAQRPITVDEAVDALWPDVDLETGRGRLAVLLYRLRKDLGLGPDELVVRDSLGLALTGCSSDVQQLLDVDLDDLDACLAVCGVITSGFAGDLEDTEHLQEMRSRLHGRFVSVAARVLEDEKDATAHPEIVDLARRILRSRLWAGDLGAAAEAVLKKASSAPRAHTRA